MKQYFLYALLFIVPLALIIYLLYGLGQGLITSLQDWLHARGLKGVQADREALRDQRRLENEQRLATSCEHDFEDHGLGLPPDVCCKCGMEREKPTGPCDHVWKLSDEGVPGSTCEKCGEKHDVATVRGSFG